MSTRIKNNKNCYGLIYRQFLLYLATDWMTSTMNTAAMLALKCTNVIRLTIHKVMVSSSKWNKGSMHTPHVLRVISSNLVSVQSSTCDINSDSGLERRLSSLALNTNTKGLVILVMNKLSNFLISPAWDQCQSQQ